MPSVLRLLPKNYLSYVTGRLASIPPPAFIKRRLFGWFVSRYHVDLSEVEKPLEDFKSLADFFVRDLKPGLRLIGDGLVSPVDGVLREFGVVSNGTLGTIKGQCYSVESLIGENETAFSGGSYANLYLSPRHYHHVHAPFSGSLLKVRYIRGKLWPVNDWAMRNVPNLFCVNERVVMHLDTEFGRAVVVMVGATNVGKIELDVCTLQTNSPPWRAIPEVQHPEGVQVTAGERLGSFHLGSSVVVITERRVDFIDSLNNECEVLFGQTLASLSRNGS